MNMVEGLKNKGKLRKCKFCGKNITYLKNVDVRNKWCKRRKLSLLCIAIYCGYEGMCFFISCAFYVLYLTFWRIYYYTLEND